MELDDMAAGIYSFKALRTRTKTRPLFYQTTLPLVFIRGCIRVPSKQQESLSGYGLETGSLIT